MTRVVSVYFPHLQTERIRRRAGDALPADRPLVVIARSGSKRWLSAADPAALKLGPARRHAGEQGAGQDCRSADGGCSTGRGYRRT